MGRNVILPNMILFKRKTPTIFIEFVGAQIFYFLFFLSLKSHPVKK